MRISDWSSDVCSSDLGERGRSYRHDDVDRPQQRRAPAVAMGDAADDAGQDAVVDRSGEALGFVHRGKGTGGTGTRSEERRVGKECVSTCRSRWSRYHYKKKSVTTLRLMARCNRADD